MARTLSYQISVLALGRLVSFLVLFLVPIVNVRTLSQADFGLYRQFWLLFGTVSVVLALGFPVSLLYYLPRAKTQREKSIYVTQTLVYLFLMGLLSWVVYGVLTFVLRGDLGDAVTQYFWAFALFTLFMILSRIMERLFVAEKRAEQQSLYIAISFFLQSMTVISVSWFTRRVDLIIWGLVVFAFVKVLFTAIYCSRVYRPSIRICSIESLREQIFYAVPLGLASVILAVFAQTDKYVITHFLGREVFAVYSVGAFQLPFVDIIRNSVINVMFPLMAQYEQKREYDEILKLWRRASLKVAVLFFPIFVFLEVSARPFITILFTEEYAAATTVFMIYLLIFVRSSVDTTAVLMVFKKNTFMVKIYLAALATHVTVSVLAFKQFGWLGVPVATVSVVYLQNGILLWRSGKLLNRSFWNVMPWGMLLVRFVTALAIGLGLFMAYRIRPVDTLLELAVAGVVYFGIYFVVCLMCRFISIEDIKSMFGRTGGGKESLVGPGPPGEQL